MGESDAEKLFTSYEREIQPVSASARVNELTAFWPRFVAIKIKYIRWLNLLGDLYPSLHSRYAIFRN